MGIVAPNGDDHNSMEFLRSKIAITIANDVLVVKWLGCSPG